MTPLVRALVGKVVNLRGGEAPTALLLFAYSFLAMTSFNVLKPISRSTFITALGADNLPYVQLLAGILIAALMQMYSRAADWVPRRWVIPITQVGVGALLVVFWFLFQIGAEWVSVALYVLGLTLGVLLISQFWTLANDVYDPRQARRLFGFVGGGASLGGAAGAAVTALAVEEVGTNNLLLVSAAALAVCAVIVTLIVTREPVAGEHAPLADEQGVGGAEAIRLLRSSRHLTVIAFVIACASIGAAIIDQQLNMAAEAAKGPDGTDAITGFLAQVTFYLSAIGFVVQIGLTSRIHRSLGLAFALLILPISLGLTGVVILINGSLWAPAAARVLDTSLRYTIDKTTREVLFVPLPVALKYRAKPFVDVTVDRVAKALGAVLILLLIKPWGLNLDWQSLSLASLTVSALWVSVAMMARTEYFKTFRRSIETRALPAATLRLDVSDGATVETLVEELSSPDEARVLYAVEMLESLDKRQLITPLLLYHESPKVRARVLLAADLARPAAAARWTPAIERMLKDEDADVRAEAVHSLAVLRREEAATLMRRYLDDPEPRIAATAAVILAASEREADVLAARAALVALSADPRTAAAPARREAAAALARVRNAAFRPLLVPLMYDEDISVAREAIHSARALGASDALFVPGLVALLGHRALKPAARDALSACGEAVLDALAHFLADTQEDLWVRRHIPATIACIPTQRSMNILLGALDDPDGFLRYKVVAALERLRREHPELTFNRVPAEALILKETRQYYEYLTLRHGLVTQDARARDTLLIRALDDKLGRTLDRIFRLLGLIYAWKDVSAARHALAHHDARTRASALEYIDTLLSRTLRKRVIPILEDMSDEERVRHAHFVMGSRPRDLEDSLVRLVHDDDPVVSASAIHFAEARRVLSLWTDFEYILEHRRLSDWYVFEAASWGLAGERLSERRWELWLERLPAVELANRLRAIPLFDFVSVDELFRIAAAAQQVRYEQGREIYHEGVHPGAVAFLLDGSVRMSRADGASDELAAPAALAFEELLEDSALPHTIRAGERALCLAITQNEFLTMFSDNIELAQGLFRMLLDRPKAQRWRAVYRPPHLLSGLNPSPGAPATAGFDHRSSPLQPIEKVLLLRQHPLLGRALVQQLLDLATITREISLTQGAVLFRENDDPALFQVLSGEVLLEADASAPLIAGEGCTIGVAETLAGVPLGRRATVTRPGRALRLEHGELFDVLADHIGLLQGIFSGLLRVSAREPATVGQAASAEAPAAPVVHLRTLP
jgi:AAA family ATP:ADP antiporter